MFSDIIARTAFTTQAANEYFGNKINGDSWNGDLTFTATMRALLHERMKEDDTLYIYLNSCGYSGSRVRNRSYESWGAVFRDNYTESNVLRVFSFNSADDEGSNALFDAMDQEFAKDGWEKLQPIRDFFRRSFDVLCFINQAKKSAFFFVKRMDNRMLHQLQVGAITALPWFFNPKNGDRLSDIERELLTSLQEKTPNHYLDCLNRMAAGIDFEAKFLREQLHSIETVYERSRIATIDREIESQISCIRDYQECINNCYRTMNQLNNELIGLHTKINQSGDDSPMLEYFLRNRAVKLYCIRGTKIQYIVHTYISFFDEDFAETIIKNRNSLLYDNCNGFPKDTVADVAKALFVDQRVRLRTCAAYYIDMSGGADGMQNFEYVDELNDRMPNPHIQYFRCLGDHLRSMNEFMKNRNFIGVIEQTIASAGSLNLQDYTVANRFFRDLFRDYKTQWFELPDGSKMNLRELVGYLEKEKEETKDE